MGITVGTRETGWGELEDLQVPMLECQECLHDVVVYWTIVKKFKRFWLDLDQDVPFGSGLCQSLRDLSERWSAILGSSVGLRTINERINQIEPLLQQVHQEPITDVPTVVQFDGIWVTIQRQTETIKLDKRQRRHHQRNGKRVVILVALGLRTRKHGGRSLILSISISLLSTLSKRYATVIFRLNGHRLLEKKTIQLSLVGSHRERK